MAFAIYWDKDAAEHFKKSIEYIRNISPLNAERVKQELLDKISELSEFPVRYPSDNYKQNNSGNYRYFELHRFRVSYLVNDRSILIARIRHTSQKPRKY